MSEQKHTPGPWKVSRSIDGDFLAVYPMTGRQEMPIAKFPDFVKHDVNEANARLIAAVPELLSALMTCLVELDVCADRLVRHGCGGEEISPIGEAMQKASAAIDKAIAKAEGRQP